MRKIEMSEAKKLLCGMINLNLNYDWAHPGKMKKECVLGRWEVVFGIRPVCWQSHSNRLKHVFESSQPLSLIPAHLLWSATSCTLAVQPCVVSPFHFSQINFTQFKVEKICCGISCKSDMYIFILQTASLSAVGTVNVADTIMHQPARADVDVTKSNL